MAPMWKNLMNNVDLDESTSFLDHGQLGCTQRQGKPNETIVDEHRKCSNLEFLLEERNNYQSGRNLTQKLSRGPTTGKVTPKSALKDVVNWRRKRQRQLYTVSTPCLDDHNFKEEELETVGDLAKVCSQIVFKKFVFGTNWWT